jgi:hypothetical protein
MAVRGVMRSAMPAPTSRIEERRLDAEAGQHAGDEMARRQIDGVGHQQVVAAAQEGQQRGRHRGHAGRRKAGEGAALGGRDRLFQGPRGRRAAPAVNILLLAAVVGFGVGEGDGRGVVDRGVDEAVLGIAPAGGDEPGFGFEAVEVGGLLGHFAVRGPSVEGAVGTGARAVGGRWLARVGGRAKALLPVLT